MTSRLGLFGLPLLLPLFQGRRLLGDRIGPMSVQLLLLGFERILLGLKLGTEGVQLGVSGVKLTSCLGLLGFPLLLPLFQGRRLLGDRIGPMSVQLLLLGFERILLGLKLGTEGVQLGIPGVKLTSCLGLLGFPLLLPLFQGRRLLGDRIGPMSVLLLLLGFERILLSLKLGTEGVQLGVSGVKLTSCLGLLGFPLLLLLLQRLPLRLDLGQANVDLLSDVFPPFRFELFRGKTSGFDDLEFDLADAQAIARLKGCVLERSAVQTSVGRPTANDSPALPAKNEAMQWPHAVGLKSKRTISSGPDRTFGGMEPYDLAVASRSADAEDQIGGFGRVQDRRYSGANHDNINPLRHLACIYGRVNRQPG